MAMTKKIIIVGGGISGLAVLHSLKRKYANATDVEIRLIEKEAHLGGTIQTHQRGATLFEAGPNGFLDSKDTTLNLIKEIGLEKELLLSSPAAKLRFIAVNNQLHALPSGGPSLFRFQPLSLMDKLRIFREPFIPKGTDPRETVYEFGKRRLGENFSKYFLDPMVSGVFGGDARTLNLKSAFPRIYELEQAHGSLIKAMIHVMREKKRKAKDTLTAQPAGQLCSLNKGMQQLIEAIHAKYQDAIQTREEAISIQKTNDGFTVETRRGKYFADHLFLCTPAFGAAQLIQPINPALCSLLESIPYAPIAVVGLVYKRSVFKKSPQGFGYLIPSCEGKEVLGVLFSSNIFEGRAAQDHVLLRIMIGGSRHPDILQKGEEDLLSLAKTEIKNMFNTENQPVDEFISGWHKAIPQYHAAYPEIRERIDQEMSACGHLHLVANYLDGISMNDCTQNAKLIVEKIDI